MGPPPRSFADDAHDCIMVRSGSGSTEYKVVARTSAPDGELPSDQVVPIFRRQRLLMSVKGEPHNSNPLEQRRMTFVRRGNNYDVSGCAFAVKPRAFGAPQAALGLDRSAHPSKSRALPQCNLVTRQNDSPLSN